MTKRICLLAGFHPKGQVADYVVYYAKHLAAFADVYYLADCAMAPQELAKLAPYTKGAWGFRHKKYDFGSWQELIFKIGWDKLAEYDECLFTNDSVLAPLFDLAPFMQKGSASPADAWAMNSFEQDYMGSFFFVLKQKVLQSDVFRQFFLSVQPQPEVGDVIRKYEKALPGMLRSGGFSYAAAFTEGDKSVFNDWKFFIRQGFPLLKLQVFNRPRLYADREWLPDWEAFLTAYTAYPLELVYDYFSSVGISAVGFHSLGFKFKSIWWAFNRWRRKFFRFHFRHHIIIVVFGWTLYDDDRESSSFPVPHL